MLPCSAGIFHYSPYTQGKEVPPDFKYIRHRAPRKTRKTRAARALPLLVALDSTLANLSAETNRWLEAHKIKVAESTMERKTSSRPQRPAEQGFEEDEKPLLAQVARLARAHTVKMPLSRVSGSGKAAKSKASNGDRGRSGGGGVERTGSGKSAESGKKGMSKSPGVRTGKSGRGPVRVPPPLGDRKILQSTGPSRRLSDSQNRENNMLQSDRSNVSRSGSGSSSIRSGGERMVIRSDSGHENIKPSLKRTRSDTRGGRLGEMMTGRFSPPSLTRCTTSSSTGTTSSTREDGSCCAEQSYIPIGLGIMTHPTIRPISGKTDSEDDEKDWSGDSIYSQESKSCSGSEGGSSMTTWPGPEISYQSMVPPPLNTSGLRSDTMCSQRAPEHDESVQSLRQRKMPMSHQPQQKEEQWGQPPFMSGAIQVAHDTTEKLSSGSHRSMVPPPGRLAERSLIQAPAPIITSIAPAPAAPTPTAPTPTSATPTSATSTGGLQRSDSKQQKYKASELGQSEMVCLKRVAEEAKKGRGAYRISQIQEKSSQAKEGLGETSTKDCGKDGIRDVICSKGVTPVKKGDGECTGSGGEVSEMVKEGSMGKKFYDISTSGVSANTQELGECVDKDTFTKARPVSPKLDMLLPRQYLQPVPPLPRPLSTGSDRSGHTILPRDYSLREITRSSAPTPVTREPSSFGRPRFPSVQTPGPDDAKNTLLLWQQREEREDAAGLCPLAVEQVGSDAQGRPLQMKERKYQGGQEAQGRGSARLYSYFRERRRVRSTARAARLDCPAGARRELGVVAEGFEGVEGAEGDGEVEVGGAGYGDIVDFYAS